MHSTSSIAPVERELSLRAVITGIVLGILLTPSNVYAGLKIGWSFNMSIIALLIGLLAVAAKLGYFAPAAPYAFWMMTVAFGMLIDSGVDSGSPR